jgi:hypothetical protein
MFTKMPCSQAPPGAILFRAGLYLCLLGPHHQGIYAMVLEPAPTTRAANRILIQDQPYQPVHAQPGSTLIAVMPPDTQCWVYHPDGSPHSPPVSVKPRGFLLCVWSDSQRDAVFPSHSSFSFPPSESAAPDSPCSAETPWLTVPIADASDSQSERVPAPPPVLDKDLEDTLDHLERRRLRVYPAKMPRHSLQSGRFQGSARLPGFDEDDYGDDSIP